jgi:hypothetical protein
MWKVFLIVIVLFGGRLFAISLPYSTGFETPAERTAWTQYRTSGIDPYSQWGFARADTAAPSLPWYLSHDYPMTADSVDDWCVSPALDFTGGSHISLYMTELNFSLAPNVYLGIWYSAGERDPSARGFTEVMDITPTATGNTIWTEYPDIDIPSVAGTGYVAIRYRAGYYMWLMVSIDDINIVSTSDIKNANTVPALPALTAFPNPFNSSCEIIFTNTEGATARSPQQIEIFDLSGKCICSLRQAQGTQNDNDSRSNNRSVSLSNRWSPDRTVASGVYLIKATTGDGHSVLKRVVYLR